LSGPSLDLIAPIRPLQLCADGGYQLRLGILGVPLIMVPDTRYMLPSLVFWWPRSRPCGGVGRCLPRLHTIVRGTPVLGYRQWPPGPPQGRLQACRWGQSLVGVPFSGTCGRSRRQPAFGHAACHVCSRSWQVRGPHSWRFRRAARGASHCHP
jgi:hypothetical protein